MKSTNHNVNHEIVLINRKDEIIIATPCGKEIASLTVQTMEDDNQKPTKSFWVCFEPVVSFGKNTAECYFES